LRVIADQDVAVDELLRPTLLRADLSRARYLVGSATARSRSLRLRLSMFVMPFAFGNPSVE
jgi:hypothetical protein